MAVGNLLYEMKGEWNIISFGNTPFGGRNDFELKGDLSGKVSGKFTGTDYGMGGADGTINVHAHETITTSDGEKISAFRHGYARPNGKGTYDLHQYVTFSTGSEKYSYLNTTTAVAEGEGFPDKKPNLVLKVYEWKA